MIITNKLGLSESLVSAVTPDAPHNAEGCISATTSWGKGNSPYSETLGQH